MILDKLKAKNRKNKKSENEEIEDGIVTDPEAPVMPSSKPVKAKLSKILSSRKSINEEYEEFHNLVKYAFMMFLRVKNPKLMEKELSYEEIKKEIKKLKKEDEKDIDKESTCTFLDKLIEMSYAPYEYDKNPENTKKEQLKIIADEFRNLLW